MSGGPASQLESEAASITEREASVRIIDAAASIIRTDAGRWDLLAFPELDAASFRPWIHEDEARRKHTRPDALAEKTAKHWKNGLAQWGQTADRVASNRDKVGVIDLEAFLPGRAWHALALRFNNLLATRGFATWLAGPPPGIASMRHGPDGKPLGDLFLMTTVAVVPAFGVPLLGGAPDHLVGGGALQFRVAAAAAEGFAGIVWRAIG